MDDAERAVLSRMLRSTYRRFLRRVEVGRELSAERVAAAAEGRLMTARVGRELGLVDEVGGLADAVARARREGGLGEDSPIEIWPRRQGALEALAELLGAPSPDEETARLLRAAGPELAPVAGAILATPRLLQRERVAVALPYLVELR
jgi:protease-4